MSSENQPQYLCTWFMTPEEIHEQYNTGPIDSSAAWGHFAPLLNSREYNLRFIGDDARSPQVDTTAGLGDSFSPSPNGPFVYHIPSGLDVFLKGTPPYGPWRSRRPRIVFAYDNLFRIIVIKAIPTSKSSELEILSFLNSPTLRVLPGNHTMPLIESINTDEGWSFAVMPGWMLTLERLKCLWQVDDYFAIIIQSLEGLGFMHENGIAHRDISPGNMVINHDLTQRELSEPIPYPFLSTWDFRLAFIDFDFASKFTPGSDTSTWVGCGFHGNIGFAAPEVVDSHVTRAEYAVLPTDIYSLGKVWDLLIKNERKLFTAIRSLPKYARPTFANDVLEYHVPQLESHLEEMLDVDPTKRPTAKEALQRFKAARDALPLHIRFSPPNGYAAEYGPSGRVSEAKIVCSSD
ncbi:kinase-like domain-containing protein [Hysterangium stoloniferum]|nr:kinase-like domain-containing protein [Hysterangium stoloniferum]